MSTQPVLQLLEATVLNTEKYNAGSGFLLGPFLQMKMVQEIIFRLPKSGGEVSVSMEEGIAPSYPGQEVELMVLNDAPVGFKPKSGNTYYLFDDLDVRLAFGLKPPVPAWVLWLTALVLGGTLMSLEGGASAWASMLGGLVLLSPIAYRLFTFGQNKRLKNQLDQMVQQDQWARV